MRLSMKKQKTSRKSRALKSKVVLDNTVLKAEPAKLQKLENGIEETEIQSFFINSSLSVVKLEDPIVCVFKSNKNEIGLEQDGNTRLKIKIHTLKANKPLTRSFTFNELERLLRNYINKKAGN